jgi:hypothetical protein
MDQKDRKIVDDAILKYGDDFWNDSAESLYSICYRTDTNRECIVNDLIEMLKQAGYEFVLVVKPL